MKLSLAVILLVPCMSLGLVSAADVSPETEDMQRIFNGKDLSGWDGDPRLWSVKDGAIRGETTPENRADGINNPFIII